MAVPQGKDKHRKADEEKGDAEILPHCQRGGRREGLVFLDEFHEKTAGEIRYHKDSAQEGRRSPFSKPSLEEQQPDEYPQAKARLIELAGVSAILPPVLKTHEAHAPGEIGDAAHDLAVQEVADTHKRGDKGCDKGVAVQYEV